MTRPIEAMTAEAEADALHLERLGYKYDTTFKRDMSFWANVSLGFTYLSPVVAIYSLFATAMGQAGPPMIWSLVIAGVGQFFVALVFGEVVSNYPVTGGVYPWARRLWGRKWAWMNGWVYLFALIATISSVAYGAGPYLSALFGFEVTTGNTVIAALALVVVATALNLSGTKVLSVAARIGLYCELGGALVVGTLLLLIARHNDLSVLFQTFGAGEISGQSYFAAFSAAALIGIFQYYGFEACGDVAEEVSDPGRKIPRAMRMTIYIGGFAATFVALSLVLATPDIGAVVSGEDADPVSNIMLSAFGPVGYRVVLAVVLVSFVSCLLSLQAAASRLTYSMARDGILPFSHALASFSPKRRVPVNALLLAGALPAVIILLSLFAEDALTTIISFGSIGIYIGFQMVVLAALRARLRGWQPSGRFRLGRWGVLVNVLALLWGIIGIVNMAWPRTPDAPWYLNYIVLLSTLAVIGVGAVYMVWKRPYLIGDAPAGDAIPARGTATIPTLGGEEA
ncbi:MAG: Amino acid permease [Pseudoclavibacter caeni]|jgi:amino acid transporter